MTALPGRATPEGTARYAKTRPAAPGHYRNWRDLTVSSIGMGTYLGPETDEVDAAFVESAGAYLKGGVNVLDTAVVYRSGRSERALGEAIRRFGKRDEVVVTTKGGFLAPEPDTEDPRRWFLETYVETGILKPEDVASGSHAMTPAFLEHELTRSLERLGLEAVDVYFVHNPETQLTGQVPRDEFERRLRASFESLERLVDAGRIGAYGLATWSAFHVPPQDPRHVSIERALEIAREARAGVGGDPASHHLGAIEMPVNLAMPDGVAAPTQPWRGELVRHQGSPKRPGSSSSRARASCSGSSSAAFRTPCEPLSRRERTT